MVYIFLADGFEDVEAITPFDFLKRSGALVKTIGVSNKKIKSSHGMEVITDIEISNFNEPIKEDDVVILPGGLKGTENLYATKSVLDYVKKAFDVATVAAICAAPFILGRLNLLENFKACCYPGFEKYLKGAEISSDDVVVDKNVITSKGAGTAQQFSFAIIEKIYGKEKSDEIKKQVQWNF